MTMRKFTSIGSNRFLGEHAYFLVAGLSVSTLTDHCYNEVLGGHERQLFVDVLLNHLWIHDKALEYVLQNAQHDVSSQKGLKAC